MKKFLYFLTLLLIGGSSFSFAVSYNPYVLIPDPIHIINLRNRIQKLIIPEHGTVAIGFWDMYSGEYLFINPYKKFNPASIIKIAVMIETFKQIQKSNLSLYDQIILKKYHKLSGCGDLYYSPVGKSYKVKTLLELMITKSDNTATRMLIDVLGREHINNTIHQLGLYDTQLGTSELLDAEGINYTTAYDMTNLLKKLTNLELISRYSSEKMIQLLLKQKFKWGIPKYLPKNIKIAHKTGSLLRVSNDVGIVFYKNQPYILCILTGKMTSNLKARNLVAKISKEVYLWKENIDDDGRFYAYKNYNK